MIFCILSARSPQEQELEKKHSLGAVYWTLNDKIVT